MFSLLYDRRAVALLLAASLTILSNTIISPALPGLEANFPNQPNADLLARLLVTAPSLVVAFFAPVAGAMVDRFGRRWQLLAGVVLFTLAGSAGLYLPSLPLILLSRLLLGLSIAMIMTAQMALIGDYFDGPVRGRFMGIQLAGTNFGGFLFLATAGWLADISPRLPFAIYLAGLIYLPYMWFALNEPDVRSEQHPVATRGERHWQLTLSAVTAVGGLTFVSFYVLHTQLPYYLPTIGHPEPSAAAMLLATVTLAGGLASLAFGRVKASFGRGGTPALGFALMGIAFGILSLGKGLLLGTAAALMVGTAIGFIMPTLVSIALDVAPVHRRGLASGAVTTSVFLGQFASPVISQPLIKGFGFEQTFGLTAALLALLALVAFFAFRELPVLGEIEQS